MKTKVDRFGRIVVPKEIRDRHGLLPGSELEIEDSPETIVLRALSELPGMVEKEGILVFRGRPTGDLDAAILSQRKERLRKTGGPPA
jgi:AbrB family looped-hinge helix DNA binding protein